MYYQWLKDLTNHIDKTAIVSKEGVEIDRSLYDLTQLLQEGYNKVTWKRSAIACPICQSLHGMEWDLEDFISNLQHDAAIYEKSHPACGCTVLVSGPDHNIVEVSAI